MRRLLLMRHAKSSWDDPDLRDAERPLSPRGERDAPRIGAALRRRGIFPDRILASPSERTRRTVGLTGDAAGWRTEIHWVDALYGASSSEILDAVRALPDSVRTVLVVGHNPGLEDLLLRLTGGFVRMPTGAAAAVLCPGDGWEALGDGGGTLEWRLTPKTLCETEG